MINEARLALLCVSDKEPQLVLERTELCSLKGPSPVWLESYIPGPDGWPQCPWIGANDGGAGTSSERELIVAGRASTTKKKDLPQIWRRVGDEMRKSTRGCGSRLGY